MTIDRLGSVDPVSRLNKNEGSSKAVKKGEKDSINISSDAMAMGEVYRLKEQLKATPDVRQEKIDEIKQKLQDPTYIDDKIVESVADKLMDVFGI
jgi:negative regulator of flagellin synthesis FlgM